MHSSLAFPFVPRERKSEGMLPVPEKRIGVNFEEHEFTIAIDAGREEFVESRKHGELVSSGAYARVVQQVWRKVRGVSPFARMPVAVVVYCEGRHAAGVSGRLHEVHSMSRKYMTSDGSLRDARLFHRLVTSGKSKAVWNESGTELAVTREFPGGVRVEVRRSISMSESVHEMASADVFIGSMSDMSQYAIRTVSSRYTIVADVFRGIGRGVVL